MAGLFKRPGLDYPDIGFALLKQYQGLGYASEANKKVLDEASQLDFPRIDAITTSNNIGSQKLLEKLGLQFKEMITLPNETEAVMLYSISFSPTYKSD